MPLFPIVWTNPRSRFSVGSRKLIDKAVVGDAVLTTDRHPFWDASAGAFVFAVDLQSGELVLTLDGQPVEVSTVEVHEEDLTAYNLEIGGIHTYYAGKTPVLVHDMCDLDVDGIAHAVDNHTSGGAAYQQRVADGQSVGRWDDGVD